MPGFNYDNDKLDKIVEDFEDGIPQSEAEADFEAELAALKARGDKVFTYETNEEGVLDTIRESTDEEILESLKDGSLIAAEDTAIKREEKKVAQAKAKSQRTLVLSLRKADPPGKRTCATCMRRIDLPQIGYGNHEICDSCK